MYLLSVEGEAIFVSSNGDKRKDDDPGDSNEQIIIHFSTYYQRNYSPTNKGIVIL